MCLTGPDTAKYGYEKTKEFFLEHNSQMPVHNFVFFHYRFILLLSFEIALLKRLNTCTVFKKLFT